MMICSGWVSSSSARWKASKPSAAERPEKSSLFGEPGCCPRGVW
ncbi:hypothetical protein ACFQXA_18885 [Nocardiopsis composta]